MVKPPRLTDKCAECQVELKYHPSVSCVEFLPKVPHFHVTSLKLKEEELITNKVLYKN